MATPKETREEIRKIIAEHLGKPIEAVTDTARLVDDLKADSLDHVELVMEVEQKYAIEIADDELDGIYEVGEYLDLIVGRINEGGSGVAA